MKKLYIRISKFLSYILRHRPNKFGLELDSNGYASLSEVLIILNIKFKEINITRQTLEDIIEKSDKRRFELIEHKIKAYYGHSIEKKIRLKEVLSLPPILYHGTTLNAYYKIKLEGLIKKNRQYVHLSDDVRDAFLVGKRRSKNPIILKINVKSAHQEKVKFFKSGDMYLADYIPPKFISRIYE